MPVYVLRSTFDFCLALAGVACSLHAHRKLGSDRHGLCYCVEDPQDDLYLVARGIACHHDDN